MKGMLIPKLNTHATHKKTPLIQKLKIPKENKKKQTTLKKKLLSVTTPQNLFKSLILFIYSLLTSLKNTPFSFFNLVFGNYIQTLHQQQTTFVPPFSSQYHRSPPHHHRKSTHNSTKNSLTFNHQTLPYLYKYNHSSTTALTNYIAPVG